MAPQTAINTQPDAGLPGQLADLDAQRNSKIDTALNAEASAAIPFGFFVKRGTGERDALLPTSKTDKLFGISVWSNMYARPFELTSAGIQPKTHFDVLRKGTVFVLPEDTIARDDSVHVRVIQASQKLPGMVGHTDDGINTLDISPLARWESGGAAGTPVKLWIDMSNVALAVTDS